MIAKIKDGLFCIGCTLGFIYAIYLWAAMFAPVCKPGDSGTWIAGAILIAGCP